MNEYLYLCGYEGKEGRNVENLLFGRDKKEKVAEGKSSFFDFPKIKLGK
jgi:hypothetical protein